MRLVFVSWSTVGGSGISQRQLAHHMIQRGHEVRFIVFDRTASQHWTNLYGKLSDASIRLAKTPLRRIIVAIRDRIGRAGHREDLDGLWHLHSPVPQNALQSMLDEFAADVVVVSSVDRWAWRRINRTCQDRQIPTVLYVREEASLDHLATGSLPTLLIANTPALASLLRENGFDCEFVPSVTDVTAVRVDSSREVALVINPIPIKGSELIWQLVALAPRIPFVIQEAGTLSGPELTKVIEHVEAASNTEFRRSAPPGPDLYSDARVLLCPYRVNSRPRVIIEAQANGIPVLASALPALEEAVGSGGYVLPVDDAAAWAHKLTTLWNDDNEYSRLSVAARKHAAREEMDPANVAARFERLLVVMLDS